MTTKNNDVLGYITCEAGGRATVHQAKRGKGKFLYTRCDCCGCDQRTGSAFQTRLFSGTEWINGAPNAPANVGTTEIQPKEPVTARVEPEKTEPEWQPEINKPEPKEEAKGSGVGLLAVLGAGMGLMMLSVVRMGR